MSFDFVCEGAVMQATTLSFRASEDLAEQTRELAAIVGLKCSDCMREAVREKNERVTAQRIAQLSKELAADHFAFNESTEDSLSEGLELGSARGGPGKRNRPPSAPTT